jgi:hypothetical protein
MEKTAAVEGLRRDGGRRQPVVNYRTEFSNVVRSSGIDGLIKELQTKNRASRRRKK